jgi:hypothetical protein
MRCSLCKKAVKAALCTVFQQHEHVASFVDGLHELQYIRMAESLMNSDLPLHLVNHIADF